MGGHRHCRSLQSPGGGQAVSTPGKKIASAKCHYFLAQSLRRWLAYRRIIETIVDRLWNASRLDREQFHTSHPPVCQRGGDNLIHLQTGDRLGGDAPRFPNHQCPDPAAGGATAFAIFHASPAPKLKHLCLRQVDNF